MKTEKNILHLFFALLLIFTVSCAGITDANLTETENTERIRIEASDLQAQDEVSQDHGDRNNIIKDNEMIRIRPD